MLSRFRSAFDGLSEHVQSYTNFGIAFQITKYVNNSVLCIKSVYLLKCIQFYKKEKFNPSLFPLFIPH